jgi:flagellar assembly protein FliH
MSSVRKFQFDESFDTDQPGRRRKAPEPQPEPEEPPPPPTYGEAELEAARAEGYAKGEAAGRTAGHELGFAEGIAHGVREGFKRGIAEAEGQVQTRLAAAMAGVSDGIERLLREREQEIAVRSDQPVHIALAIVRRMMPELNRRHGMDEVEGVIRDLLAEMPDEPRLSVRTTPELVEPMREKLNEMAQARGFEAKVIITEDPEMGPGDCTIEWAEGGAERNTSGFIDEIDRRLGPLLDARPGL